MRYDTQREGGYMLLLLLLIGTALGLFFMFGKGVISRGGAGTAPPEKSVVETELQSVQKAQNVKDMLEQKSRDAAAVQP